MKKILFVCMGNICRSPMAEGVVRHIFEQQNIEAELDSAGTIAFHSGESPDPRSQFELQKHGIDISNQRARQFRPADLEEFDLIYAMDHNNYQDILAQTPAHLKHKVDLFMNLAQPGENIPVPDPYYGGDQGFSHVYEMINASANVLAKKLKTK
jgi:protein-tyrosine phosphatase